MENYITGSITVTNMSSELFNDALFYKEESEKTVDILLKRRYQRTSLVCFCASAEAWINVIIKDQLSRKKTNLTSNEQSILDYINDPNKGAPNGFGSVRKRLYNSLPSIIMGQTINWNNNKNEVFEAYIELSNKRNAVVHYASKNSEELEINKMEVLLNSAPDTIESLFTEYNNLRSIVLVPDWFHERKLK